MAIQVNNIEVVYHDVILVLKGLSLEIPDRAIVCLLGANGAGKTTTLKAISGLLATEEGKVTDGNIVFDGKRIDNSYPEDIVKLGIAQVMEGRRLLEHLTTEENLKVGAYARAGGNIKKDLGKVYGYFPRLESLSRRTSGYLSGGEQQMLVVARSLMLHPKVLLLDEPSLGLAPLLVREIFKIIERINADEGTAILLVEQNAKAALEIASHAYIMENGKVVLDGPCSKLKENPDIKEFYLGLTELGGGKRYRDVKHYRRRKRWVG